MPTFPTSDLPVPESWEEFEAIVTDVMKNSWDDPYVTRNGRTGQRQNGVDIYGHPDHLDGGLSGVQCKNITNANIELIQKEVEKAKDFRPQLDEYIFACSAPTDARLQSNVRELRGELVADDLFDLRILFWDDLSLSLSEDRDLLKKHYPQFIETSTSMSNIEEKIVDSDVDDWKTDDEKIYIFEKDVAIRIERSSFEEYTDFNESWAAGFSDPNARKFSVTIFYESSPINREYIVAVDGYRIDIPLPDFHDHTITEFQYRLGEILNIVGGWDYDRYLRRAGIRVIN